MILDQHLQDEINVAAARLFWRTKLMRGERLPVRQLLSIAQQEIEAFHDASAGLDQFPLTDMARFVAAAEKWLERQRGRLWKIMQEEEST